MLFCRLLHGLYEAYEKEWSRKTLENHVQDMLLW